MSRVKHTERKIKVKGFGKRLYYAILDREMNIAEAARKCGFNHSKISAYVNDRATPNAESLYIICKRLNVSADYLLGLTDEKGKAVNS